MKLGLALGVGGARGFCHIGVLRALEARGITPAVVAGGSMGAVVGAAWAANRLDALEDWARSLTRTRFLRYVDVRFSRGGVLRGQAIKDVLKDLDLPPRIEDLDRPFIAIATDMATGREVWLEEGPLYSSVRASVAIPGIFQPYRLNGRYLLDGGISNPIPVNVCRAMGARTVIGVNPNDRGGRPFWEPRKEGLLAGFMDSLPDVIGDFFDDDEDEDDHPPDIMEVIDATVDIAAEYLRKTREAADPPDLMLGANLSDIAVLELYRAGEAIDAGRAMTEAVMDQIEALVRPGS